MKLIEALRIAGSQPVGREQPFRAFLCCGFTPLHLQTFLVAHLRQRVGDRRVEIATATYGDCIGSLERAELMHHHVICVVLEWADLDSRLGYRQLGGWGISVHEDVLQTAAIQVRRLEEVLQKAGAARPVAFCPPSLPLPPLSHTIRAQESAFALDLRHLISESTSRLARLPGVAVISNEHLGACSPPAMRLDLKSELIAGFPYHVGHAAAVAECLAAIAMPLQPKKGLITDLDDTFWQGIVGEVGVDAISYELDAGSQIHALYQQFLAALAEAGVLIGVASRNDPHSVTAALSRTDLHIRRERLFPVEAHWGEKSESVRRILQAWNVSPEDVVVIDDSARELAEIQAVFPEIECRLFTGSASPSAALELFRELRDLFGRPHIRLEDAIRAASVPGRRVTAAPSPGTDEILAAAEAELTVDFDRSTGDGRGLELVNKTNQFNLNGRRYTVAEWANATQGDDAFVMTVAYRDRFGPLGRIAVLSGRMQPEGLTVTTWVMSCRAFARRIEHRCLAFLFERFAVETIRFDFVPTARNAPTRLFFREFLAEDPVGPFTLSRADFDDRRPALHQDVHVSA